MTLTTVADVAAVKGGVVTIRPIRPDDADALARFHRGLSAETQRKRFLVYHPDLSERELHWFTEVDHDQREALVALDDGDIVAVARYDRTTVPHQAEIAIVVADDWQRRGVGAALLSRLVEVGQANGITEVVADALSDNVGIVRLLATIGVVTERDDDGSIARLHIRLAPEAA